MLLHYLLICLWLRVLHDLVASDELYVNFDIYSKLAHAENTILGPTQRYNQAAFAICSHV